MHVIINIQNSYHKEDIFAFSYNNLILTFCKNLYELTKNTSTLEAVRRIKRTSLGAKLSISIIYKN